MVVLAGAITTAEVPGIGTVAKIYLLEWRKDTFRIRYCQVEVRHSSLTMRKMNADTQKKSVIQMARESKNQKRVIRDFVKIYCGVILYAPDSWNGSPHTPTRQPGLLSLGTQHIFWYSSLVCVALFGKFQSDGWWRLSESEESMGRMKQIDSKYRWSRPTDSRTLPMIFAKANWWQILEMGRTNWMFELYWLCATDRNEIQGNSESRYSKMNKT